MLKDLSQQTWMYSNAGCGKNNQPDNVQFQNLVNTKCTSSYATLIEDITKSVMHSVHSMEPPGCFSTSTGEWELMNKILWPECHEEMNQSRADTVQEAFMRK